MKLEQLLEHQHEQATRQVGWWDPQAQTFLVDDPGEIS